MARVVIFGSSFNPMHRGHEKIINFLLEQEGFDEIWLLPTWQHPYQKKLAPWTIRLELLTLFVEQKKCNRLKICTVEHDAQIQPSYTFAVMMKLKELYSQHQLTFAVGADNAQSLAKWHRIDELKNLCSFLYLPRAGVDCQTSLFGDVSSSQIREALCHDQDVKDLIPPALWEAFSKNSTHFKIQS